MGRVKINLASGNVFEKPLVTFFKGTNGDYIVLDNETNGSMGLPIICIGRVEGTTVNKIVDPTEWTSVKENLKTIISGTSLPYLSVPENLSASDEFYTQLTLPIASFDLLKSTYSVQEPAAVEEPAVTPAEPMADVSPVGPVSPIDMTPVSVPPVQDIGSINPLESTIEPASNLGIDFQPASVEPIDVSDSVIAPIEPTIEPAVTPIEEPVSTPSIEPVVTPVAESTPEPAFEPAVTAEIPQTVESPVPVSDISAPVEPAQDPIAPIMVDDSISNSTPQSINGQDLTDLKETFMKSCENMFDALVEKLKN